MKLTIFALSAFFAFISSLPAQQNVQQISQKTIEIKSDEMVIKKADFLNFVSISEEFIKIQKIKKIETQLVAVEKSKAKVIITLIKDMKHANDLVFESHMVFNAEIESIDSDSKEITVKFKKDTIGNVSNNWFKSFISGFLTGSVSTIVIVLIIVL